MEIDITKIYQYDFVFIDIREYHQYRMEHLKNSFNVEYDILELAPERYLSKEKKYCLYCDKGIKSLDLSKKLNSKGYQTYSIKGGFEELKNLNFI